jgi:hypothetical protein
MGLRNSIWRFKRTYISPFHKVRCPSCFREFYPIECDIGVELKETLNAGPVSPARGPAQPMMGAFNPANQGAAGGAAPASPGQAAGNAASAQGAPPSPGQPADQNTTSGNLPPLPGQMRGLNRGAPAGAPAPQIQPLSGAASTPPLQPAPGLLPDPIRKYHYLWQAPQKTPGLFGRANVPAIEYERAAQGACRICPYCRYPLPTDFERVKSYIIPIVGDRGTGKTLYLGSMIEQFEASQYGLDFLLKPASDEIGEKYRNYYRNFINNRQIMPGNKPSAGSLKDPFIFTRITGNVTDALVHFIFYDVSGEDIALGSVMRRNHPQIRYAHALIFMADPVYMKSLQTHLRQQDRPKEEDQKLQKKDPTTLLLDLTEYIRLTQGKSQLSIPVAIMLPKSDVLRNFGGGAMGFPAEDKVFMKQEEEEYRLPLKKRKFKLINDEVRSFIEQYGDRELLIVSKRLKSAYFCASSATSCSADNSGKFNPNDAKPLRTLDPMLWTFSRFKLLRFK